LTHHCLRRLKKHPKATLYQTPWLQRPVNRIECLKEGLSRHRPTGWNRDTPSAWPHRRCFLSLQRSLMRLLCSSGSLPSRQPERRSGGKCPFCFEVSPCGITGVILPTSAVARLAWLSYPCPLSRRAGRYRAMSRTVCCRRTRRRSRGTREGCREDWCLGGFSSRNCRGSG
jgi:hypothetical protein